MRKLSVDIETYSSVDIKKSGLYKYANSSDFEVLLFAYSFDGGPIEIVDLAQGEQLTQDLINALSDPNVVKCAYNATFEWYCLNRFYQTPLGQWRCTMVKGLYCGYPAGLASIGQVLGLEGDKQKMWQGSALIKYFCCTCKPTKSNGGRMRNLPHHEPEKWGLFKEYCKRDVLSEMAVADKLSHVELPEFEQKLWVLDTYMNAYGALLDKEIVEKAISVSNAVTEALMQEAVQISGLDNPNSVSQLKKYLEDVLDEEVESLNKKDIPGIVEKTELQSVKRLLTIRQELGKTSVKKYQAMENAMCSDNRVRGLLQFYGANRTGRWAGRLVQIQNLPRNYLDTIDLARSLLKKGDLNALKLIYGNIPDTLSQLIRTAFIAPEGYELLVVDFSSIEARIISWLADEDWRLEVFRTHGKIYEASASQMFGVPLDKIKKGNPEYELRQKGKVAELALGYQGGVGALIQMNALEMGLKEEELQGIVDRWRMANPKIVKLWNRVQKSVINCMETGIVQSICKGLTAEVLKNHLVITLPSKRQLFYANPQLEADKYGKKVTYMGQNQTSKKWERIATYGGKLTENIVQAVARDCLAEALMGVINAGFKPVFHVHDEIVCEVPKNSEVLTLENAIKTMCTLPRWAKGLPLNADGFVSEYYKKE